VELRHFVSTTLNELIQAISDSAKFARDHDAEINPWTLEWQEEHGRVMAWDQDSGLYASEIEFDIAIAATEGPGHEGGIEVLGFKVAADGATSAGEEHPAVSRVRFTVPVVLPASRPKPAKVMKRTLQR
jgi:hypothetical protein